MSSMTPKQIKANFNKALFLAIEGEGSWDDHCYQRMIMTNIELQALSAQMKVKYEEIKLRTGKENDQLKTNYQLIQEASDIISKQLVIIDEYSIKLNELERKVEYYQKQQPMVDFSKLRLHHNGQRVKYIKDFINDDNF